MSHELQEEASIQLGLLRKQIDEYKDLRERAIAGTPSKEDILALAAFLHSFYTGIENLFKRISKHLGKSQPRSEIWHRELLENAASSSRELPPVISEELRDKLSDYLAFRHFFRQAYPFDIQWNKMSLLVSQCETVFEQFEKEIGAFLPKIN